MPVETIPTTNEEVDRQIGGGLPLPTLMIIQGANGSGKSTLVAQLMQGLLAANKKVLFVSDNAVKNYLDKMKVITYDFTKPFLRNQISIMSMYAFGTRWSKNLSKYLFPIISRYLSAKTQHYQAVVIDSLSHLSMYSTPESVLDFFTRCKHLVSNGTSIIMTLHDDVIPDDMELRIISTCDCYLKLRSATIAGRDVRISQVIKYSGSSAQIASQFSFEVDNVFGIKIVPLSTAG